MSAEGEIAFLRETLDERNEEIVRLKAEIDRLYRFVMLDPDKTAEEAKALEPGSTAEACRAINVWNRSESFRVGTRQLREARAENERLKAELE